MTHYKEIYDRLPFLASEETDHVFAITEGSILCTLVAYRSNTSAPSIQVCST